MMFRMHAFTFFVYILASFYLCAFEFGTGGVRIQGFIQISAFKLRCHEQVKSHVMVSDFCSNWVSLFGGPCYMYPSNP